VQASPFWAFWPPASPTPSCMVQVGRARAGPSGILPLTVTVTPCFLGHYCPLGIMLTPVRRRCGRCAGPRAAGPLGPHFGPACPCRSLARTQLSPATWPAGSAHAPARFLLHFNSAVGGKEARCVRRGWLGSNPRSPTHKSRGTRHRILPIALGARCRGAGFAL
jgi:hypothetical protein